MPEGPHLLRVPREAHGLEPGERLRGQRLVGPDDPERAERKRARVALAGEERGCLLLDTVAVAEPDERVEPRRRVVEAERVDACGEQVEGSLDLL